MLDPTGEYACCVLGADEAGPIGNATDDASLAEGETSRRRTCSAMVSLDKIDCGPSSRVVFEEGFDISPVQMNPLSFRMLLASCPESLR